MRHTLAVAATALVLPFTLSACGEAAERAAEKAVEKAIEDGASGDVDVDFKDGEVKIEHSDGSYVGGGGLPDDFPDDVPLVGDVQFAGSSSAGGARGWSVSTRTDGSPDDAIAEATSTLEGAGFTSEDTGAGAAFGAYAALGRDPYQVAITATEGPDGGTILTYLVSAAE